MLEECQAKFNMTKISPKLKVGYNIDQNNLFQTLSGVTNVKNMVTMRRNVMGKVSVCERTMETMQYIQEFMEKGKGNPKCKMYK